jgi:hypothetical protein
MSKLIDAMGLVNDLNKSHGVAQRGGKKYTQVVHRMEAFRTVFGTDMGVDTQIMVDDGQRVVIKATITDSNGICIGSGMAEEIRGQGNVNKTSALENCETSAIGRALACIGLAGGEYASANEMAAVPRKEEALKSSNQGGAPTPDQHPPAGPDQHPPAGEAAPPVPSTPDDPNKASDVNFYKEVRMRLDNCKTKSQVTEYFMQNKSRIKELKDRSPERAAPIIDLFKSAEAKYS